MSTIDIPAIGPVDKKWVIAGGATVAVIVGYAYFRSSGRSGDDAPADGGDPADDGTNAPGDTGDSSGSWSEVDPDEIDTIQEWTADVVAKLSEANWDAQVVYATIGKWIAGEGLTAAEKLLVMAAIAAGGQPPGGPYPIKSATPIPTPTPDPDPDPTPTPTPTPTAYVTVKVAKYTSTSPPWNSTMWGIAKHYGYGSASGNYVPIWNDAKNAALKALRKDPKLIRAGDTVYVKPKN